MLYAEGVTVAAKRRGGGHARARELLDQAQSAQRSGLPGHTRTLLAEAEAQLRTLKPSLQRDGLLALALLRQAALGGKDADRRLRLGVSYARSSRDPEARALAQRLWTEASAATPEAGATAAASGSGP